MLTPIDQPSNARPRLRVLVNKLHPGLTWIISLIYALLTKCCCDVRILQTHDLKYLGPLHTSQERVGRLLLRVDAIERLLSTRQLWEDQ